MKLNTRWIAILSLLVAAGCSQPSDNNENNGETNNTTTADMGSTDEDVDNSGVEYADEYEIRMDTLQFTIDPGAKLNGIIATNLNQDLDFPIVVLLEASNFDAAAGSAELIGGSGEKTAEIGVYTWEDGTDLSPTPAEFNATTGQFSATLDQLDFVATFEFEGDVNSSILPIKDLFVAGQLVLEDDGATARIANGELAGHVTKEDGDDVMIVIPGANPRTLTSLLNENTLNFDTSTGMQVDAGDGDAWYLEGVYTGVSTEIDD